MSTSALMESEPAVDLQEQALKALEEARAAARRQEEQAAAARREAEALSTQRLDATLKEHIQAWAARLGTTVSDWPKPTHTTEESNFWEYGTSYWTHYVTANFFADGIYFQAKLCDGHFCGVTLRTGVELGRNKRIESLLDLGEELDRLAENRRRNSKR